MTMLADLVDVVIGVDTHKHTHTAAVIMATTSANVDQITVNWASPRRADGEMPTITRREGVVVRRGRES